MKNYTYNIIKNSEVLDIQFTKSAAIKRAKYLKADEVICIGEDEKEIGIIYEDTRDENER